jgi:flagellar basal body rod protein FlgG
MDPAYYVAAGSLKARSFHLETLSNNLANTNTVGYKTERSFFSVFNKARGSSRNLPLTPSVNDGTVLAQRGMDFSQGPSKPTGRNLDLAIEGNAFFMIQTPQGPRATRDGRFQLGPKGEIQTLDGSPVLGKNGQPLKINPTGGAFTFGLDGTLQQDQTVLGQLDLKAYKTPAALPRTGSNRYDPTGVEEAPATATVTQGYLEQSGVDVASTMVDMIRINRLFEMSMKVASTITNDLDARSINDIAAAR